MFTLISRWQRCHAWWQSFPTPDLGWVLFVYLFSVPRIMIKVIVKVVPFVQLGFYTLARKESKMFSRVPFNIKNLSITTEYMALYLDWNDGGATYSRLVIGSIHSPGSLWCPSDLSGDLYAVSLPTSSHSMGFVVPLFSLPSNHSNRCSYLGPQSIMCPALLIWPSEATWCSPGLLI